MKPSFRVNEKRFYLPGVVVTSVCPGCGQEKRRDLGEDPALAYPMANKPFELTMHHECDEETEHQWPVTVELVVELRAITRCAVEG